MTAQLEVLPDPMDIILNKLATSQADVTEVIADVKLVLEQTDDAVRFAEDTRIAGRHTLASNRGDTIVATRTLRNSGSVTRVAGARRVVAS